MNNVVDNNKIVHIASQYILNKYFEPCYILKSYFKRENFENHFFIITESGFLIDYSSNNILRTFFYNLNVKKYTLEEMYDIEEIIVNGMDTSFYRDNKQLVDELMNSIDDNLHQRTIFSDKDSFYNNLNIDESLDLSMENKPYSDYFVK